MTLEEKGVQTTSSSQWECDNGHEFPIEDIKVERCLAGNHYRCPYCDTTNIRKVKA